MSGQYVLIVVVSGCAGTGKSLVLNRILARLKDAGVASVYPTATTGLAACHLKGTTLQQFAGIGKTRGSGEEVLKVVKKRADAVRRWKTVQVRGIAKQAGAGGVGVRGGREMITMSSRMAEEDQKKKINTSSRQRTRVSPRLTRSPKLLTENVLRVVLSTPNQTTIQRSKTGFFFFAIEMSRLDSPSFIHANLNPNRPTENLPELNRTNPAF